MKAPNCRLRLRTLLISVALLAVLLGVTRMALRMYRAKTYRQQAQSWADDWNRYRQAAALCRLRGDTTGAAKRERLAAYCEEWRQILQHAASNGEMVILSSGPSPPK
jgi:hypothetical protein